MCTEARAKAPESMCVGEAYTSPDPFKAVRTVNRCSCSLRHQHRAGSPHRDGPPASPRTGCSTRSSLFVSMHHPVRRTAPTASSSPALDLAYFVRRSPTRLSFRPGSSAWPETRRDATIIAGTGTDDTATGRSPSAPPTSASTPCSSSRPTTTARTRAASRPSSRPSPPPPTARSRLQHPEPHRHGHPQRPPRRAGPDGEHRRRQEARYEDMQPSTAWTSSPATTTSSPSVMDMGGTGGILVASQLVGREMRRIIDGRPPQEIEDGLRDLDRALTVTTNRSGQDRAPADRARGGGLPPPARRRLRGGANRHPRGIRGHKLLAAVP